MIIITNLVAIWFIIIVIDEIQFLLIKYVQRLVNYNRINKTNIVIYNEIKIKSKWGQTGQK